MGKSRFSITCEQIARAALGDPTRRAGPELLWHCSQHDDEHESLSVNVGKDVFMCGPCGVSGTAWQLAAFLSSFDPSDKSSIRLWLQELGLLPKRKFKRKGTGQSDSTKNRGGGGYSIPPDNSATVQQSDGVTLEQYASDKKLPVDFLRKLGLSDVHYQGSPAVRIPYYDQGGFEVSVKFRIARGGSEKFRFKKGSKAHLYGLSQIPLAQSQGFICIVEGISDPQTLMLHGVPAVGIPGAGSWQEPWADMFDAIPLIYVFIEPDSGGQSVMRWLGRSRIRERVKIVRLSGVKDVSELHLENPEGFREAFDNALANAVPWAREADQQGQQARVEAWQKCAVLAQCPDILGRLPGTLERLHLVGEGRTVKLVYLAVTSRLLPPPGRPVSIAVKGPSSGGKSYAVEQVLKLFPASAFHALSAMSERALAYSEEPLTHRMLVLYEAVGMSSDFASYLIRSLLSEGRLRYETVEKTRDGLKPRLIEREGPTGLIVTTTKVRLHPENETRIFSITVDDSEDQTKAVISALASDSDYGDGGKLFEEWQALQKWLECGEHRVVIPYAKRLAELIPPVAIRMRRDFGAILNLIRAHALLHQASRREDGSGRVIATIADYAGVRSLVWEIVSDGVEASVSDITRETVNAVRDLTGGGNHVSVSQLAAHLKLNRGTVSRRVEVALSGGYLKNLEDKQGRPFKLSIGDPMPEDIRLLPEPEDLECCSVAGDSGGINIPPSPPPGMSDAPQPDPSEQFPQGENDSSDSRTGPDGTDDPEAEKNPFNTPDKNLFNAPEPTHRNRAHPRGVSEIPEDGEVEL